LTKTKIQGRATSVRKIHKLLGVRAVMGYRHIDTSALIESVTGVAATASPALCMYSSCKCNRAQILLRIKTLKFL
jgi:hypothetical protein